MSIAHFWCKDQRQSHSGSQCTGEGTGRYSPPWPGGRSHTPPCSDRGRGYKSTEDKGRLSIGLS